MRKFKEQGTFFSQKHPSLIFSILRGLPNPRESLQNPNSVVLTRETAEKYFGN
jgi:hypothetical protein